MPLVSVMVVFHRESPYLDECLRSLLGQTLRDLEVILVDNGTGTGAAALARLGHDSRLKLVALPGNQGCSAAYRAALPHAQGELLGVHGYDDISLPRRFELQVARFRREPSLGLLMTRARAIDERGGDLGPEFALTEPGHCRDFSNYSNPGPASSLLARAEAFRRHPFRSEFDTAEDYDFVSRVAEDWTIAGLEEELLLYRRHAGQVTQARQAEQVLRAGVIRLLTARRRAGRAEGMATALASVAGWHRQPPAIAAIHEQFARWAGQEGLPALAVYEARRLLAVQRTPRTMGVALRIYLQALRQSPARAFWLSRLFLTGPLRAHGIRVPGSVAV
jgi:hypothetical protein